MMPDA